MSDDRGNREGTSGRRSSNPLNVLADVLAAAWGAAVGFGRAVFGGRRPERGTGAATAAGPQPDQPEAAADSQPHRGAAAAEPAAPATVAPKRQATSRKAAGAPTARRGARPAAPVKQGAATKPPQATGKGSAAAPASAKPAAPPKAGKKAAAKSRRPPALDAPRGGKPDDLKQIAGLGPKLEEKLNGLGIYHYDQIAGWSDSAIAWIDAELQAKGRVGRDNWVAQAAALMSGAKPSAGKGPAA